MPNNIVLDRLEAWQAKIIPFLEAQKPVVTGLPRHRMGLHLIGNREADLRYAEDLGPAAAKIVDPDPAVVRRVLAALDTNGVCVLRDHPLSEQKADMARDPIGTGRRHAIDWITKLTTGRFAEFGKDRRIVVCGINEPDVHNQAEEQNVYQYTKIFLETLTANNVRALALNLSVGWPRNSGPETPPIWDTFMPLEPIINAGNHFLCVHEYWYPDVKSAWGWYGNRIGKCPMSVPIIIGECGYTRQLANLPQPWGWRGNLNPATYAEQLWYYHDNVDKNVFAIMPFTTGYASADWESKDTQPAHADILGRVRAYSWPALWPVPKTPVEPPVDPPTEGDPMLIIVPRYTGRINGFYGQLYQNDAGVYYPHEGMDLAMPTGTPLYAPADGIVAWADPQQSEKSAYGIYCRTYHPQLKKPVCFFNAHMSECLVKTGNSVKQGQPLGYSGNTGNSSGDHLHWEVRIMTASGAYQVDKQLPATLQNLYRQNGRTDPLAWLRGWEAAGGKVEER